MTEEMSGETKISVTKEGDEYICKWEFPRTEFWISIPIETDYEKMKRHIEDARVVVNHGLGIDAMFSRVRIESHFGGPAPWEKDK